MTNLDKEKEFIDRYLDYSQYYELPYNPLNKMVDVIGTQESGTKVRGKAFNLREALESAISFGKKAGEKKLLIDVLRNFNKHRLG
jgi:hypothetical protein